MSFARESKVLVALLVVAGCAGSAAGPSTPPEDPGPAAAPADAPAPNGTPAPEASAPASAPTAAGPTPAEPDAAATNPPPDKPPAGSKGAQLMRDHFADTVKIRDAVIAGKLEAAVRPAANLAAMEGVETLPKLWQVSAEQLRTSSKRIREDSDLQELAAATADIGRACGHCHGGAGGPKIEVGAPPEAGSSVASRMKRHKWGTDRLWEGLYGPSTAAWKAGAEALALDPFPPEALAKGGVHAKSAASRFNDGAKKLGSAKSSAERGAAYAEMLATCAPCHEAMGVKR